MKIKQTVIGIVAGVAMFVPLLSATPALADCPDSPPAGETCCGTTQTSILGGNVCGGVKNDSGNLQDNAIWKLLLLVLNIMTAGVGILAVAGIVYGSILYTSAGDSAEQTKKAISVITNVVIGIIAYALMYLVLNFLIPGGIFS